MHILAGILSLNTCVYIDGPFNTISLRFVWMLSDYYLNELIVMLLPQDQFSSNNTSSLFINYAKSLEDLATATELEIPLREFEYHLLSDLGVLPDLSYDVNGNLIQAECWYQLIPSMGFTPTSQNKLIGHTPFHSSYLVNYLIKFADLSSDMYADKQFMLQIKALMRILIQDLLGGQELKSRALFQTYQPFGSSK